MGTNIISLSYIFTTNLWGNSFQTGFKDEDVEAWQPSDIINIPQLTRQSRNKLWSHWHLVYTLNHSSPVCLLNGFLRIFTHWKFSPGYFSLINQHCTLETKAYKVESTWIQSLALFCKHDLWSTYLEHAQRKDGNQQNRTKICWYQGMFSLCSDVLPNIIGRASNHLTLFIYRVILCIQAYNFFLLRSIKNNTGHFSKALHPRIWKDFTDMPFISTN